MLWGLTCRIRTTAHESVAAHQRQQIRELQEDIADYQDENAQLKAELQ